MSDASAVDPEEAFVASLASCHMLWFLDIACRAGWVVDDYCDDASGLLAADERGRLAMTCVTLRPRVCFGGDHRPDAAQIRRLHDDAHEACFIANSVRTELRCEPVIEPI
jgi:organic hydroperoxide reductase OsmC/OhrA